MSTIYLAGKMGDQQGSCDCGVESCHNHCEPEHAHKCGSTYIEKNWRYDLLRRAPERNERVKFSAGYTFGGPWFIDNHGMEMEHIARECLGWISQCDAVFAWLSAFDAHGTFAEMGYAKALGKPVFAAIDRNALEPVDEHELWFIKQLADGNCAVRDLRMAFAIFTHWLAARQSEAPSYGHRW